MNGFLIVLWFVFGIAGVYIGQLVNLAHNDLQPLPGDVWCVLLGPIALLLTMYQALLIATARKEK